MKTYRILLFLFLLCSVCIATIAPSRAADTLPPPPMDITPGLFAATENTQTAAVAYAWTQPRAIFTTVNGDPYALSELTPEGRVTALVLALPESTVPVVAWQDRAGISTAINVPSPTPANPRRTYWISTLHGRGRNPQLLTNPLRLIYFDARGAFTCQQWSGTQWQHGCEA